jgi:uncharacterized protein (TIGR02453 family)
MADEKRFSGFTKETVRFFTALRKNNNKEWFDRNRETYDNHVMAPAKLFVTAMGARLKTIAPRVVAVPKVNKSIFRINRDTRFSLDPSPYKTNLGILFWDGVRPKMESSGFYFHLEPPDLWLGVGMYMIPDALLSRFRKAVVDAKNGAKIKKIGAAISAMPDFSLGGERPGRFRPGPSQRRAPQAQGPLRRVRDEDPGGVLFGAAGRVLFRAVRAAGAPPPLVNEYRRMSGSAS